MRALRWIAAVVCSCTCVLGSLARAEEPPAAPTLEARLDTVFEDWNRPDRPGGVALVVQDGQVLYKKGFGLASLEYAVPNTPATVFDASALAGPMTGLAVAQLVAEGKIALDEPVQKILPELSFLKEPIRVRDLLEQRSGLWDWQAILRYSGRRAEDAYTFEQILELLRAQKRPDFKPGSAFGFSATNFVLLGEVIRQKTGQSLRDFAWEHLLKPRRMTRTLFRDTPREPIENRAYGYNYDMREGCLKGADSLALVGSSNLFTSLDDLARWLPDLPAAAGNAGYGFNLDSALGTKRLWQSAAWGGFKSALLVFPDRKLSIAVLSNWDYRFHDPKSTAEMLAGQLLSAPPAASAEPPAAAAAKPVQPDLALLDSYVGDYRFKPGDLITVVREGDRLLLVVDKANRFQLVPSSPTEFGLPNLGFKMAFEHGPAGRVERAICHYQGQVLDSPRIVRVHPKPAELKRYTGSYQFEAFNQAYQVELRGDQLTLVTPGKKEIPLEPEAADHFMGRAPLFPLVIFTRSPGKAITGFKIAGEGTPGIFFKKKP